MSFYPSVRNYLEDLTQAFETISPARKVVLEKIAKYISLKKAENKTAHLIYICTHNSRRSQFGQIWSNVIADFYGLSTIKTYSGGTETTAFHPNAIAAIKRAGLLVEMENDDSANPHYIIKHGEGAKASLCYSKIYDDAENRCNNFAAIMTCGEAEENCPFIPGAELRISTTYEDPKLFDKTELEDLKYDERCRQIALETLYAFSKIEKL